MTRAELKTSLQAKGYATDTDTAQNEAINSAYRKLCGMRRWPWLEAQSTAIVTVAGTASYSLAGIADLLHIDAVRAEIGTEYYPLQYRLPQEFREYEHVDRDNGTPRYWTFINNALRVWPKPDRVYTLTIDYVKDPADLTLDANTPIFPATYHDILVWGAICEITFREREWAGYSIAKSHWKEQVMDMMSELGMRQRQTAKQVVRSSFWGTVGMGTGDRPYGAWY